MTSREDSGVASSLQRLERREALLSARVEAAEAQGDEPTASLLEKRWTAICRELLRYEAQVDETRRKTGTLVPTAEVLFAIQRFCLAFNYASEATAQGCGIELERCASLPAELKIRLLEKMQHRIIELALSCLRMWHYAANDTPQWLRNINLVADPVDVKAFEAKLSKLDKWVLYGMKHVAENLVPECLRQDVDEFKREYEAILNRCQNAPPQS
jgi:hypothetical protein